LGQIPIRSPQADYQHDFSTEQNRPWFLQSVKAIWWSLLCDVYQNGVWLSWSGASVHLRQFITSTERLYL